MVAEEEENQLRRCRDEHESQPVIQADPTLENGFGETTDANPGVRVWTSPAFKNLIDRISDFLSIRLRSRADLTQQALSDSGPQGGIRCLR